MPYSPINLAQKLSLITEHWQPRTVAHVNGQELKLVKFQGKFVWHSHSDTEEAFLVISGEMEIRFRDGSVFLKPGELFVVPQHKEHITLATEECHALIIEKAGTVNTGNAGGEKTAAEQWV